MIFPHIILFNIRRLKMCRVSAFCCLRDGLVKRQLYIGSKHALLEGLCVGEGVKWTPVHHNQKYSCQVSIACCPWG